MDFIVNQMADISIHAPRAGSDAHAYHIRHAAGHFNPRSPCGERQVLPLSGHFRRAISIHAPRAGSDALEAVMDGLDSISIHAPRAGSDLAPHRSTIQSFHISIHAPRAGSDPITVAALQSDGKFQSTLPVRGATAMEEETMAKKEISIHAPRAGSDHHQPRTRWWK